MADCECGHVPKENMMTDTHTAPTTEHLLQWIEEARERLKTFGTPAWGSTDPLTDAEHIANFSNMLRSSRERFDLDEKTEMHDVRVLNDDGSSFITAMTGNTPQAAQRAQSIAGYLMAMPAMLETIEYALNEKMAVEDIYRERIKELLEHNNELTFQNRDQRIEIKKLQAQVAWLMERIPGIYSAPESDQA